MATSISKFKKGLHGKKSLISTFQTKKNDKITNYLLDCLKPEKIT